MILTDSIIILIIILALCGLVSINTFLSIKNTLRPEIDQCPNFSLLGQFNYDSNNISTWTKSWSKLVDPNDIIIAVPNSSCHKNPSISPSRYLCYQQDNGFYSPYINIAKALRMGKHKAILFVHDDMILTSSLWKKLGKTNWITARQFWRRHDTIKIYKNGSTSVDSTWSWWKMCYNSFTNLMQDSDFATYLHASRNGDQFINVRHGQSDMLYAYFLNDEQERYFLDILDLFAKHKLFLECALPTAVLMMEEKFGLRVYTAPLCTSWDYGNVRKDADKMIQYCAKKKHIHEAYHPIKISKYNNWTGYFDELLNL